MSVSNNTAQEDGSSHRGNERERVCVCVKER